MKKHLVLPALAFGTFSWLFPGVGYALRGEFWVALGLWIVAIIFAFLTLLVFEMKGKHWYE